MKFFLDTARVEEIRKATEWGIVDGVTTNPTHIAETGRLFLEVVREICSFVEGPISVEAISTEADKMVREAQELASIHPNIVVKIPLIEEGIKAIRELSRRGIRTNATLNFSPTQALLAAKVGATYVSPFVGRLDAVGHIGMGVVEKIRRIYDNYNFDTQIIVSAVRHPVHVLEAALMGADVATMRYDIMNALFDHPLTEVGLEKFLEESK